MNGRPEIDKPMKTRNVTLLADRLCYLDKGMDGLHVRYGMSKADKSYRDEYDRRAAEIIAGWIAQEQDMILTLAQAIKALEDVANDKHDGHYTILKFTTGYKVIFGTLDMNDEDREYVLGTKGFKSLKDAISYTLMED